jgi:hypothetical protein
MFADQVEQAHAVARLTDHLEAGPPEQAGNPLADEHVVVRHDNPAAALARLSDPLVGIPALERWNHLEILDRRRAPSHSPLSQRPPDDLGQHYKRR